MKPVGYNLILLTPVLLLLQFCASAQGVVFTATAGAQKIGLEDQIEVNFTIHNAPNLVSMGAGQFKDFAVVGGPFRSSSSSSTIANGRVSQSVIVSLIYVLQPRRSGSLVVSPAQAKDAAGNIYQSNSLNITVVKGSLNRGYGAAPPPQQQMVMPRPPQRSAGVNVDLSKDLVLKAIPEKSAVHTGEPVTITWKLYHRVPLRDGAMRMPQFNGVYTQNLDSARPVPQTIESLNGRRYFVDVVRKVAVFPQKNGDITIDPAVVEGYVPMESSNVFNDPVFQQAMGGNMPDLFGEDIPVAIKSAPVVIHVQPLSTADQPQNFTGAVGIFSAKSSIDKTNVSTDDIVLLTMVVAGRGNFKLFSAPKLNLPRGLTAYEPKISDSIGGKSDGISGSKTITYSISPQVAGDFTIPAQSFTYFDPETGKYESAGTTTHTLHVRPGRQAERGVKGPALTEIHDIDTKLTGEDGAGSPIVFKAFYWLGHASPLLAFVGLLLYRRRSDTTALDTPDARKKRARAIAVTQLAKARTLLEQKVAKPYYEAVSGALWQYLSSKLSIPASQLSRASVQTALILQGVKGVTLQELAALLDECDSAIYAPGGAGQMTAVYSKAAEVITDIEAVSLS